MAEQQKDKTKRTQQLTTDGSKARMSSSTIEVDLEEFLHFLDDSHLSDEEKMECLEIHWRIICDLMSLGFGIHPVQQAKKACGQDVEMPTQPTLEMPKVLELGIAKLSKHSVSRRTIKPGKG